MENLSKRVVNYTSPFNWKCPFCNRDTTITPTNYVMNVLPFTKNMQLVAGKTEIVRTVVVKCPNTECEKLSAYTGVFRANVGVGPVGASFVDHEVITGMRIVPEKSGKILPDYIPPAIRQDFGEAAMIQELSPKASATISRRCLQGMLRDFWKVKPGRLVDEIDQIKDRIDELTFDAIDSLRKLGNIGAHMEKDINTIIDVDENEADLLISLNEMLLESWYVDRHEKEAKMKRIKEIAKSKKA